MMASFSFVLNEECDWNCPYCYFKDITPTEPKLDVYKKHLPYIKNIIDKLGDLVVNIDVQGGEIGYIPIEILEYFFQTFKRPIVVSTNGKFMENGYHLNPKIRPYISAIFFHYYDFSGREVKDYDDDDIPILRGITHNNIDEMVYFIKQQSDVIFDYVEFEFDIDTPNVMDSRMYSMLIQQLLKLKNISTDAINILRSRLNENPEHRNNCMNYNHSILIDMVNENICLCQRQLDISIPLSEENIIYRLKTFPKDLWMDLAVGIGKACDSCTRLYAGKFNGNVIERALLTRSRI